MNRRRYQVYGIMSPTTAGGPMDLDTLPIARKEIPFESLPILGTPLTLINLVLVEGVDHPFFTRLHEGLNVEQHRRKRISRWLAVQHSNGTPFPVAQAAPNEEPIFNGKVTEVQLWSFKKRLQRKTGVVFDGALQKGFQPFALPATNYTVTLKDIEDEIRMHLLEYMDTDEWSFWEQDEVRIFLIQRVIRFIMETGIVRDMTQLTQAATDAVVELPEDLLELRRVAWEGVALPKTDAFVMDHGRSGWYTGTGVPDAYIEEPKDPLSIQLVQAPALPGEVHLIYLSPIGDLSTQSSRNPYLPLPAAFCPAIKYGIMADMLLKEGEAHDPVRAEYCEARYSEGVQLAKLWIGAME